MTPVRADTFRRMDGLAALEIASEDFLKRVRLIGAEQWSTPDVCGDWTARDVVGHVLNGCYITTALLEGATRQQVLASPVAPVELDVADRLAAALARQHQAFARPGALEEMLDHPNQPMKAKYLIGYRTVDLEAHAWDLSRSLGLDEELDARAVAYCWEFLQPLAPVIARLGLFGEGPSATVGESSPLQVRLLDFTGRRPAR